MSDGIERYLIDLKHRHTNHDTYWAIPLSTAYTTAFDNFKETLATQRSRDEARAKLVSDLILLGVSLPIGGVMTARLGHAVIGRAVGSTAVKTLSRSNWSRANAAATWLQSERNGWAGYILGEAFKDAQKRVKAATASQIAGVLAYNPLSGAAGLFDNPLIFKNRLQEFNGRHYDAAASFAEDIRDSKDMTGAQKDAIAAHLRQQAYFTTAGNRSRFRDPGGMAQDIELLMWCAYVLNTDFKQRVEMRRFGKEGLSDFIPIREGRIDMLPSDRGYPASASTSYFAPSSGAVFRNPGDAVLERVSTLWSARISSSRSQAFLKGRYDVTELVRAEQATRLLAARYRVGA